jgi:hypothetical protein
LASGALRFHAFEDARAFCDAQNKFATGFLENPWLVRQKAEPPIQALVSAAPARLAWRAARKTRGSKL